MRPILKEKDAENIFTSLKSGKNSYMRLNRLESSSFDMTWINAIENCILDLGEIVNNPREVTKTVANLVPVELARKTNSESVQHLASHTQYIKDISESGDVVPNKILSMNNEEDIHTYENRFIATLIRRLLLFVEKRYEFVKNFSPLHDEEILYFKNSSIVNGEEVEIETKIKVRSESETKMADISNRYLDRIKQIREYVLFYYGSKFMRQMRTDKDVRNPIVMTNILRKNPKYHKCYELYRFIERYDQLGVSYHMEEDATQFNEQQLDEINTVLFTNFIALKNQDKVKQTKKLSKTYKPKILSSIDDEEFIYGDLLRGPIEFVRMDELYQKYLEEKLKKDLPVHPTKLEKEYYKEEYEQKKEVKEDKVQKDKLAKRKVKAANEFDKKAKAIIIQREKEEQERIRLEQERLRLEEEARIEKVRQELIAQAKKDNASNEENIEDNDIKTPLEVEETPVEEVKEEQVPEEAQVKEEVVIEEEKVEEVPTEEPQVVEEHVEETPIVEEEQPTEEAPIEEPVQEEVISEPIKEEEPQVVEEQPVEVQEESKEDVLEPQPVEVPEGVEPTPVEEEPKVEKKEPVKKAPIKKKVTSNKKVIKPKAEPKEEKSEEPQKEEKTIKNKKEADNAKFNFIRRTGTRGPRYIKIHKTRKNKKES